MQSHIGKVRHGKSNVTVAFSEVFCDKLKGVDRDKKTVTIL
jgi:translation initiation factor 2 gamma subunit (eIF-2gamma)